MDDMATVPSVDNGNASVMDETPLETPSEQPEENVPAEQEPAQSDEPEEKLFELPDGRKVDGETLAKEWKENFLPEFTRKSQTLAEIERAKINNQPTQDPYSDPDYTPQTYAEIIQAARESTLKEIEERQKAQEAETRAIEEAVAGQIASIREKDPNLDENALFLHANKYGFRDLVVAHQNMKDMAAQIKTVQQTTVRNIAKRMDPVSTATNQPSGSKANPAHFQNASDYLRAIKG